MAQYRVDVTRSAAKELENLDPRTGSRVLEAVQALTDEPGPRQSRKLVGSEGAYRIRVGSYRVLYLVDDARRVVTVIAVGHRRDVYRRMPRNRMKSR